MLLSKAMSTCWAVRGSVLGGRAVSMWHPEVPPGDASTGSAWPLLLFSSVWEHKVSDENTFCFPEAVFQVAWAQNKEPVSYMPASLPSQGSGVLSFVL